jgi:hypothetical protein
MAVALVNLGPADRRLPQQEIAHAAVLDQDDVPRRLALMIHLVMAE